MKAARLWCVSLAVLGLAGCGGSDDHSDLTVFVEDARARPTGTIEALPKFRPYEAFTYNASSLRSPFQPPVKIDALNRQRGSRLVKPDETRVKQFLEGFNIETFEMVGTIGNESGTFALLSGAGGVHRVKVGDYLGRSNGRIVSVSDAQVEVVEIVPDGEGGWLERPRSIPLKERS
ncbi:pilus assembly protein PilP [Pseudomonas sp. 21LCFQ02]|uniref:pilus assembly protein PilP n=1 Tax=unclassified Pseudomonas TaxID=196821 RepID=UPI0004F74140|nr:MULTISPECIES: pilus assembly protein PilP [unclassified Pseudomonas]MCO8167642.1 pilus assembly protein PilP [Pseudomonas sp. 21LCFQ02]MCQ9424461.1 pilus assembly protein PilP [Pseudomonas sp. LJDD11]BAP42935.1 type IV pilus biogenesis protein PilP [Pseudomonas sp. StFLB209]